MPTLLWFRQDLRLQDNPAVNAAIERGAPVIPVYILDDDAEGDWPMGGASRWWLHHALTDLAEQLSVYNLELLLRRGDSELIISELVDEHDIAAIYWNRRYEPAIIERDKRIKTKLREKGLEVDSFNASLLFEPWTIKNNSGDPYKVFTPFWKACLTHKMDVPVECDLQKLKPFDGKVASDVPEDWGLLPEINWDDSFYKTWTPTRAGGFGRLSQFNKDTIQAYRDGRNRPDEDGTSCLSPYLHFGQLGPREVYDAVANRTDPTKGGARVYISEIGWREFSYHILYHFPKVPSEPLRGEFENFPWEPDKKLLRAWQKGQTGYPLVDAGMRQLWSIGWLHNRVRMNVASLLVKHLQQPWQAGARWFWDTLVDADLANNTQGWQWTAGCGADGAPYFRVFNPILQGQKFDKSGDYVRTWVPELAKLPTEYIHCPWDAPGAVLREAGVALGKTYPRPIVDHKEGRDRALSAYDKLKNMPKT